MHTSNGRITAFAALAAIAAAAIPAAAGIKYWDNPDYRAFDVDCYVPGAVWNYDGIRNQGATAAHDNAATTWVNLGSSGDSNDVFLQKHTGVGNSWGAAETSDLGETYGEWTGDGFVFKGNSRWRADSPKRIDTGKKYTIQFLVDASSANHTASYATIFNSNWDKLALLINTSSNTIDFRTVESVAAGSFASIPGPAFTYATAIANSDDNTEVFFSGTVAPTSGVGFRQSTKISGHSEAGYVFGGANDGKSPFKGTFKFFRYYQKVLSNEELAWNRVVDERRFFDRAAPLPITNAVVVSSVAASAEPAGTYAVDGRHVFTAPRVATVGNTKYICTGYALEEWDDAAGDWGTAVFHARELSCAVTSASCVRITWKWTDAAGLATYDISDYVWTGLEVFYDGICNQGTNVAHSTTATNWLDIGNGPKGASNNLKLQRYTGSGWADATSVDAVGNYDPGEWTDNGFKFAGQGRFRCDSPGGFTVGTSYSLQMLVDAKSSEQITGTSHAYPFAVNNNTFAFDINDNGTNYWCVLAQQSDLSNYPLISGGAFDYFTAIMDGENNTQSFFSGTSIPSSGDGYKTYPAEGFSDTGFALGGYGKTATAERFVGTIKNFRQYDHALSPEEVAQNRKVDNFRYFGKPVAEDVDVIVQSTYAALQGNEPDGEYDVDGSHTFTAPATATLKVNGKTITYSCAGYTVETNDGEYWQRTASGDTSSVAIAEDGALKRLTWLWKPVSGLRTAADYSFDDYSQAGLVWNYDGIYNAGIGTHDSNAAKWKNLGSGANADLHWNGKTTTGEWASDGYIFRGGPRFKGDASFHLRNFTMQTLVDADASAQTAGSTYGSIFCGMYQYFNIYLVTESYNGSAAGSLCWRAQTDGRYMYFKTPGHHYTYATAIQDFESATAKIFPGVAVPDTPAENDYNAGGEKQRTCFQFGSMKTGSDTGYGLGQRGNETTWGMVGKLKNFRYYDRVLTEEEIIRNRNADAVRYFGALGVTNLMVEVAEGESYTCDPAPGAYFVEGSYEFTADPGPTGYKLQTWDETAGAWRTDEYADGLSCVIDASASPSARRRLVWCQRQPLVIVVR